jgi:C_GCAxxG_C_C family probable redox protein
VPASRASHVDLALALFRDGYNCAQAIVIAFAGELGVDRDTALRAACGFGGGLGHRQETCGVVTGALLVLGWRHGRGLGEPKAKSDATYELAQEFMRRFEARHGTCVCRDLLGGCDFNTDEGERTYKERGYRGARCEVFVRDAVEILEELARETPARHEPRPNGTEGRPLIKAGGC